jgi:hypothetical protein
VVSTQSTTRYGNSVFFFFFFLLAVIMIITKERYREQFANIISQIHPRCRSMHHHYPHDPENNTLVVLLIGKKTIL